MTALLLSLILLTLGHVTVVHDAPQHPLGTPAAYRICVEGHTYIYVRDTSADLTHEYAGALDCMDDGAMNGSTFPDCDVMALRGRYWLEEVYAESLEQYDKTYGTSVTGDLMKSERAADALTNGRGETR